MDFKVQFSMHNLWSLTLPYEYLKLITSHKCRTYAFDSCAGF
jgi:hypothetical protein